MIKIERERIRATRFAWVHPGNVDIIPDIGTMVCCGRCERIGGTLGEGTLPRGWTLRLGVVYCPRHEAGEGVSA